jgi:LacI family transcriptional regulator
MTRVTIREVAEKAGVSIGTVSNALNHPNLVAEETLRRIKMAIKDVGFVPNAAARQLRSTHSPAVGLVVLDIGNPFFAEVARGVEAAANAIDHLVILCSSASDRSQEAKQLRLLEEQRVAGILITPVGRDGSTTQQQIRDRGTAVVLLDRRSTRRDRCSVAVDDIVGGKIAGQHLVDLGHSRVGLINGPRQIRQCADRRNGFLAAIEAASLKLDRANDIEAAELTIAAGAEATRRLLAHPKRPTAVFCANDLMALGAEHAAVALGLAIPDDLAIIGYDDVAFASLAFVPLTSVRQPAYDLGRRSAELLFEEAYGEPHNHEQLLFTPELVIRESTAGPSAAGGGGSSSARPPAPAASI